MIDKSWKIVDSLVTQFRHESIDYDLKDTFDMSAKNYIFDELQLDTNKNTDDLNQCLSHAPRFSAEMNLNVSPSSV